MPRVRKSTLIRNERRDTVARKRAAFEFQAPIKKPLPRGKGYDLCAAGERHNAPVANYPHSTTRSMNDEICR